VILSCISSDPESKSWPFCEKQIDLTGAECVLMICEWPSTVLFQSLIELSLEHEAIKFPDGATFTSKT